MKVDRRDPTVGGRALGAWPADGSPAFPYDSVDRRIIALLQQDGRMSNTAIARALGLSEATVRRRINQLLESRTIQIVAVPSPETVGLTLSAIIGISCDLRRLDEVAQTIAGLREIRYLGYSTGPFDLILQAFFYSHQHLLDFLQERIATIEGITDTETAIILKVAKFSFDWELPLEVQSGEA
jgi:Lrp/AsnC family transcriptional regulator, regulator for asnA, asnC and gidA